MRSVGSFSELERGRPAIVTIGAFDGVHRGHQFLIRQVVGRARALDYDSVVVTFDPRPEVVLRPTNTQLTGAAEKIRLISALGPDVLVLVPFTRELAQVPAGEFLGELLEHIHVAEFWVGADFAFGYQRKGTPEFLVEIGRATGFAVHVVNRQTLNGRELSSSAVRRCVEAGVIPEADELLGHRFRVTGSVVVGAGRGAPMGYPTANMQMSDVQTLPALGIYAAYAWVDGERHRAAVSVGTNPTFDGTAVTVEPFLLDFERDLRGQVISLDFVQKVRDEVRFDSVEALVAQMDRDVIDVRHILDTAREPGELNLDQPA